MRLDSGFGWICQSPNRKMRLKANGRRVVKQTHKTLKVFAEW
jgi:hypothetical protein